MKKIIILVLVVLFFQKVIYSQVGSKTFSTTVKVTISNSLLINKVKGDLDFGDVLSPFAVQTLAITPDNGVLYEVNGIPRRRISVDYSSSVTLNNSKWLNHYSGTPGEIIFNSDVDHTGKRTTYTSPRDLRNGRRIRIKDDNGIGRLFIWVGGDVEVNANQPPGLYEGIFNITVAY